MLIQFSAVSGELTVLQQQLGWAGAVGDCDWLCDLRERIVSVRWTPGITNTELRRATALINQARDLIRPLLPEYIIVYRRAA